MNARGGEELKAPIVQLIPLQILLIGCGTAVLYSNTSITMLLRHSIWLAIGLAIAILLVVTPLERIWQLTPLLVLLALVLNITPHLPGLKLTNAGSARWIQIGGVSLQVSEVLKLAMILYVSRSCTLLQGKQLNRQNLLKPCLVLALAMLLIIMQKDYSTTMLLLAVLAMMLFFLSPMLSFYVLLLALLATLLAFFTLQQQFRMERFQDWLGEGGEQINWVHQALMRGGIWGVGVGRGEKKLIIPAEMTDFPLSSVGEETGLIGIAFVSLLFFLYTLQGLRLARHCRHTYSVYLCVGLTSMFSVQALTNLLVTAGLMPVTGQPLPFFSVGGSAVLLSMANFGLMNNIRNRLRKEMLHA